MLITPSFKKSLIVEQFQGNYLNRGDFLLKIRGGPWGGPWTGSMDRGPWGGPWTGSMDRVHGVVHGVVHGPRSMFCIRPIGWAVKNVNQVSLVRREQRGEKMRVSLRVRTCELFLCFVAIVRVRAIVLTSLFSLFYVRGRAENASKALNAIPGIVTELRKMQKFQKKGSNLLQV